MRAAVDLTDREFGRLRVLSRLPRSKNPSDKWHARWLCQCKCGKKVSVRSSGLLHGGTQSCGCGVGRKPRHGHAAKKKWTPTYLSWMAMKQRCRGDRANYGGRGIQVCSRWRLFDNFLADMGERPSGTTIDRIDNCRGYEPGNCRWATSETQGNNRRNNRILTLGIESMTMAQWAKRLGVSSQCLRRRIHYLKWPLDRALTELKNGRS